MPTTAIDVIRVAFAALTAEEQDETLACLQEVRLLRLAHEESTAGVLIRALVRAAEITTRDLTIEDYNDARSQLKAVGEDIPSVSAVIRHFGSWRSAKESLVLADMQTAD